MQQFELCVVLCPYVSDKSVMTRGQVTFEVVDNMFFPTFLYLFLASAITVF